MEKQLQPKLRFSEFSGDWEFKILDDISIIKSGGTPSRSNPKFWNGDIPWITTSLVNNKEIYESEEYITSEAVNNSSAKLFPVNTILMAMYGQGNTRGRVAILKIEATTNQACAAIEVSKENDYNFIYQLLIKSYEDLRNLSNEGGQKNLSLGIIKLFKINIPSLHEQQKIADYLTTIDRKIELLEEKKTELSRYKKAMMQKLFSQEIRFKDENGNDYPDWEEKRLGDVFNSFNGLTGKTKENFGFGKPYIKYTQVFGSSKIDVGGFDLVEITANDKQNQAQYGDAFFTVSSETPHEVGMSSVLLDEVDEVYLNSFCFGIRLKSQNLNPHYYRYFFRSKNFRKEVVKLAQGSTRYNMSKVEFMKINIEIPSLSEQQKIADFFSAIDESITKVEEQIKETQNFKKAMLQQLFV